MAWQGKVFDAEHGTVNNRVSPFGFESVLARIYKGGVGSTARNASTTRKRPVDAADALI
jgi:hypothetical protein